MKKKIFSILLVLVLVLSLSLVMAVPVAAQTAWYVDAVNGNDAYGDGTQTWVDTDTSGDWTAGDTGPWATITKAITSSTAGDTINVAAGTYTEDLTVNITNLTIQSASGMASTTIQLVSGVGIDIQGGASNFTLGGASGQGFTITPNNANTTFDIQLANAPSGVTISYNTIDTTGSASMGVSVGAAGASGLTVSNNTFTAETGDGSIWGPKVVDVAVSDNTFTGPGSTTSGYAVEFAGVTGTSTISGNTISGYGMGVAIFNGEGTSGLTINGNTISGCNNGIRLGQYSPTTTNGDMTTVTVTQNTLTNNTVGIRINDGANVKASQFTISNNSISDSTTYGLQNEHASEAVTAEDNWWGSASGPEHTGNTFNVGSQGDAVTDSVDYVPWLDAGYPTGASFAPVTVGTSTTYHASIQAGIDTASTSDTITCQTGTFTEDLTVNIADLTLQSVAGSTTIQLVTGVGIDIQGGADSFTLGGAANQGFTILSGTGTTFNIQLANAPSGVEISYNTIDTTGSASMGVSVGAAGASGLTISNNTFTAEDGDGSIWGPTVASANVSNNTFTGPTTPTSGYAIQFSGVTGTSTINANTITNMATGIFVYGTDTTVSGLTISGNTISGSAKGIRLGHTSQTKAMTTVTVTQNTLSTNTVGIYISADADVKADEFVIISNSFSGNITFGLQNLNTLEVTAECNWWGHPSGPTHASNPLGTGDPVSNDVDYEPWRLEEGGSCYQQAQALNDGWTLVSTDNWIDTTATSWEGTNELSPGVTVFALQYIPSDGDVEASYVQATVANLKPVNALYVKTDGGGGIGIVYSGGVPGASSKKLKAGWNLISSASAIPSAYQILSPLRYVQVGDEQGIGLATLVSQGSYNRNSDSFYNATLGSLDWYVLRQITLDPFDGYWVYMNAAKGFGVIPD